MMGTLQDTYNRILGAGYAPQIAYTMTDIGTWYAFLDSHKNDPVNVANYITMLTSPNDQLNPPDNPPRDPWASNQYVLMPVNQAAFGVPPPQVVNTPGAQAFIDWMLTSDAETVVNGYMPDGTHRGFIYNADQSEHFPDDPNLIQSVP